MNSGKGQDCFFKDSWCPSTYQRVSVVISQGSDQKMLPLAACQLYHWTTDLTWYELLIFKPISAGLSASGCTKVVEMHWLSGVRQLLLHRRKGPNVCVAESSGTDRSILSRSSFDLPNEAFVNSKSVTLCFFFPVQGWFLFHSNALRYIQIQVQWSEYTKVKELCCLSCTLHGN